MLAPQPFYEERGTPIAVKWVAENLAAAGHAVDLVVFPFGQDIELPGVRIIRCARPPGVKKVGIGFSPQKILCDVTLVKTARKLLKQNTYDVIHACEESVFPSLWLSRRAGISLIYDMDSSMADQLMEKWGWLKLFGIFLKGFENLAIRGADLVLPVCKSLAEKVQFAAPGKPHVILHDQAMQFPAVPAGTEDLRAALNLRGPIILYVGNLEHYQGMDLLLDGFALASSKHTDAALVIIGGAANDVETYRAKASALGLSDRIHLLGPRPLNRLQYYLDQADILVSPRLRGVNTPMKVYSYLLSGKAVVATRIVSHTQVMDDSFACLVEPTPEALGEALVELLGNPGRRKALGVAAASIAQARHTAPAYRASLLSAYDKLNAPIRDVVVVGGGIHGAAATWMAARLGLKTDLVEMGDFGGATSASSLKVLHGGLRYLQHGNFSRMRESIRARRRFLQLAPHLCKPQAFLMPTRGGGVRGQAALSIALKLNDLIACDRNSGIPDARKLPRGRLLNKEKAGGILKGLNDPSITGAAVWYDGLGDNTERLTLSMVLSAESAGARISNYTKATRLLVENGTVVGVEVQDLQSGITRTIRSRLVINATGPWLEQAWQGGSPGGEKFPLVGAWNIVVNKRWFGEYGVALESTQEHRDADALVHRGKRNLFFVPWREGTMIGTVYEPFDGDPSAYRPKRDDIRAFVDEINAVYPPAKLTLADITFIHIGVQPGPKGRAGTSVEPDKHSEIIDHGETGGPRNLLSIKGVKYTTGLAVGEEAGRIAARMLGVSAGEPRAAFYGSGRLPTADDVLHAARARGLGVTSQTAARLASQYGGIVESVLDESLEDNAATLPGAPEILRGEIRHAVRREHALHLADVILRRTEMGSFAKPSPEALEAAAQEMAPLLKWSQEKQHQEIAALQALYPFGPKISPQQ